jgi:hypothetical protein
LKRPRFRLSYSNVVATMALFFALAGGAWAATQLPKESVGSTQLKNEAVTPGKLSAAAKKGFTGAAGQAGPQGALGPRGNEGQRGENGAVGATGPQGIRGATGTTGATGSRGEPGEVGMRGERGLTGQTGSTGAQGEVGARGERGEVGSTGAKGERGEVGETGAKGEPGAKGETGARGETGEKGERGEQGIQGKRGERGEIGPSDAYVDVSANEALWVGSETPKVPLELTLPVGQYVLQAVLTVRGNTAAVTAKCSFEDGPKGLTLGPANAFQTTAPAANYGSLTGTTTAVVSEEARVGVSCEATEVGAVWMIPLGGAHLTATKVGALHASQQPPAET